MTLRAPGWSACVMVWLGFGGLALVACGAASDEGEPARSDEGEPARSDEGEPARSAPKEPSVATNPFAACPTPIGSAGELARTPRADANLELLALTLDAGELTATQATYERVVADVEAIRESAPDLAPIEFRAAHDGRTLFVSFGDAATEALGAGTYTAWDCLLETYRAEVGAVIDAFPTYAPPVYLDGIFDMPRLAELFAQLPDVVVDLGAIDGRGTLCAARDGERFEYVVDHSGGVNDSPASSGGALHFASDAPGDVVALDSWRVDAGSQRPGWLAAICR